MFTAAMEKAATELKSQQTSFIAAGELWQQDVTPGLLILVNREISDSQQKQIRDVVLPHRVPIEFYPLPKCFKQGRRLPETHAVADKVELVSIDRPNLEEVATELHRLIHRFSLAPRVIRLGLAKPAAEVPLLWTGFIDEECSTRERLQACLEKQVRRGVADSPAGRQAAFARQRSALQATLRTLQSAVDRLQSPPDHTDLILVDCDSKLRYRYAGIELLIPWKSDDKPA